MDQGDVMVHLHLLIPSAGRWPSYANEGVCMYIGGFLYLPACMYILISQCTRMNCGHLWSVQVGFSNRILSNCNLNIILRASDL